MRICKNKITDDIRDLFGANPVKIPESRITPFCMIEIRDKKPKFLGQFEFLLKGDFPNPPAIKTSQLAAVSGVKTKKIDLSLGFNILENLLKAFSIDSGVVSSALNQSKKIAFSFDNVQRLFFEPLELGKYLADNEVLGNPDNFFVKEILKDNKKQLALITDVIVSNNFSLSSYSSTDMAVDINIPLVEKYLANLDLKVKVEKKSANQISFVGPESLTFAFSCVEIILNPITGRFSRGEWIEDLTVRGATRGDEALEITDEAINRQSKILIDQKKSKPKLLEF